MKPGETVRYACDDCHIVFDLSLAPFTESADDDLHDLEEVNEPDCCPFCGMGQLEPRLESPVRAGR